MDFLSDPRTLTIFFSIVMIGVVYYLLSKQGRPVDANSIIQAIREGKPLASEIAEVARMGVLAAEEYARTGQIPQIPEEKLRYAMKVFRRWIPAVRGVSDEEALDAIHAFVPYANSLISGVDSQEPLP